MEDGKNLRFRLPPPVARDSVIRKILNYVMWNRQQQGHPRPLTSMSWCAARTFVNGTKAMQLFPVLRHARRTTTSYSLEIVNARELTTTDGNRRSRLGHTWGWF